MKIMVAKIGLDGHSRGAKVISRALKDAGHTVLYTGLLSSPEIVSKVALEEDVDLIGVSILSGAHLEIAEELSKNLKLMGLDGIPVVFGGIIPQEDIEELKKLGVKQVFTPGESLREIINTIGKIKKGA